jgi:hypothetical protein
MWTFAWVVGHGGSELFQILFYERHARAKNERLVPPARRHPAVFFFKKAFVFLKRALKNSDLGKCRVIIVQRMVKSLSKAFKKPQQKPLHVA